MKIKINLFFLVIVILPLSVLANGLKLMTFNFQTTKLVSWFPDWYFLPTTPEKMKKHEIAVSLIKEYKPTIIGFQEPHLYDMNKFCHELSNYRWVGDTIQGKNEGDINAIMYQKKRFKILQYGTFWLNEDEQKYERGWDAQHIRSCTYAQFLDKEWDITFWVFNTHLGLTSLSREKSSEVIAAKAKKFIGYNEFGIIMGDLNTTRLQNLNFSNEWIDTYANASNTIGPTTTYIPRPNAIIDYILINQNKPIDTAEIITFHKGNLFPSDHFPLMVTLQKK